MIDSNNQFNRLTRSLVDATRNVMEKKTNKHGHDAVGHEDEDINNDGKNDGTDKYLHNRRKAIASSMKKEEVEAIDELSKDKLTDYRSAAKKQGTDIQSKMKMGGGDWSKDGKDTKTLSKRLAGYKMAGRKTNPDLAASVGKGVKVPANEEVEQVDEISKATMGRYINKAKDSIDMAAYRQGGVEARGSSSRPLEKKLSKRHKGIETAVKKLTREEVELEEALDAAARYGQHHVAIKELMKSIDQHVRNHKDDALKHKDYRGKKGVHWGHVGDLAQVHSQLADIHDRLAQQGEYKKTMGESVEEFDIEQIDELSKSVMGSYVKKAADDFQKRKPKMGYDGQLKKMQNRKVGVNRALDKMYGEDVELDEAPVDGVAAGSMNNDGHLCATKVFHKEWAEGTPIFSQHAEPDADGNIAWYDVMFEHGIEKGVSIEDLDVLMAESHERHGKRKMKEETSKLDDQTRAALASFVNEARGRPRKNPLPTGQSDEPEPRQHIMQQLQRAKLSMRGGEHVTFKDGTKHHVAGHDAEKILAKYSAMKPSGKEEFQKKIHASHTAFKAEL
jgi:hypothetical protein